ncbi:MAG: hypothetical protein M0Z87_07410 [Actinomycetota bacterium]|nr:hypothetical protein [Actinomycetota bacterium]
MSWLFAFSIPFMIVALAIAVLPLVYTMMKDHRSPDSELSGSGEPFARRSAAAEVPSREAVGAGR